RFAEGDHAIRKSSNFLCLGLSCLDTFMFKQRGHQASEQGPPVFGLSPKLSAFFSMTHGVPLVSLLVLLAPAALLRSVQLHAQPQTHLRQDFLNFVERFLAEIFRPQHLPLSLLN